MATSFFNPSPSSLRLSPPSSSTTAAGRSLFPSSSFHRFHLSRSRLPRALGGICQASALRGPSLAAGRLAVRCGAVKTIGQSEFAAEVLGSDLPVLVDFVADWCGPCRLIGPVVEWASQEYDRRLKVVKIDHDANPQLIEEYKVYGLPSLILFKNGQEVPESRREGAITKAPPLLASFQLQHEEAVGSAGMKSLRALAIVGVGVSGILSFATIASADKAEHGLPPPSY